MTIVADTSPINYLVLIDLVGILPRLYTRVLIPHRRIGEGGIRFLGMPRLQQLSKFQKLSLNLDP
jgi:predicted nucleic acid-binding protein